MSFQQPFTKQGVSHPGYWKLAYATVDTIQGTAIFVFNAYHDKAARQADAAGNVLSQKSYRLPADSFSESDTLVDRCYELARSVKDTLKPGYTSFCEDLNMGGIKDPEGNPSTMDDACESFFASATDA